MTPIGYARTRHGEQDPAPMLTILARAGCGTIFCDEMVRLGAEWPQLDRALAAVPDGGTLIVCRLIHLGRSLEHLAILLNDLDQRGIRFRSLHEQFDTAEHGEQLLQVIHGLVEVRKVWRSENTKTGIAAAIRAGRKPGRRPEAPLTPGQTELAHQLQAAGHSVVDIATLLGVSRSKLYRVLQPQPQKPPSTDEDSGVSSRRCRNLVRVMMGVGVSACRRRFVLGRPYRVR